MKQPKKPLAYIECQYEWNNQKVNQKINVNPSKFQGQISYF